MATTDGAAGPDALTEANPPEGVPGIAAYSTTEERVVFTESKNCDGWIATDLVVEPER